MAMQTCKKLGKMVFAPVCIFTISYFEFRHQRIKNKRFSSSYFRFQLDETQLRFYTENLLKNPSEEIKAILYVLLRNMAPLAILSPNCFLQDPSLIDMLIIGLKMSARDSTNLTALYNSVRILNTLTVLPYNATTFNNRNPDIIKLLLQVLRRSKIIIDEKLEPDISKHKMMCIIIYRIIKRFEKNKNAKQKLNQLGFYKKERNDELDMYKKSSIIFDATRSFTALLPLPILFLHANRKSVRHYPFMRKYLKGPVAVYLGSLFLMETAKDPILNTIGKYCTLFEKVTSPSGISNLHSYIPQIYLTMNLTAAGAVTCLTGNSYLTHTFLFTSIYLIYKSELLRKL